MVHNFFSLCLVDCIARERNLNYHETILSGLKGKKKKLRLQGKGRRVPHKKFESSSWRKIKLNLFVYSTELSPLNKLIATF